MMTMLHSVLSGGGSAAGRRRSLLAIGALLALLASLLIWAAPGSRAQAQGGNLAPIAFATTTNAVTDGSGTLENNSFDPDGGDLTVKWEVLTEAYSWVDINTVNADGDLTFTVPTTELAARYGQSIEFKLTVTDNGTPNLSASATVTFHINQRPSADIAVSANLEDKDSTKAGVARYTIDAVIDGPGENGNADNEWDIMEGALVVLDGSGSSDPNGTVTGYDWIRIFADTEVRSDGAGFPQEAADADDGAKLSTDTDAEGVQTLANITDAESPYFVYYSLRVTDAQSGEPVASDPTAIVKLVVWDQPSTPSVSIENVDEDRAGPAPLGYTDGIEEAAPPGSARYIVAPKTAKDGFSISASATDGDGTGADSGITSVEWEGVDANSEVTINPVPDVDMPGATSTATFTAPDDVEEGDTFTITVTVSDGKLSNTATVTIVVATNAAPEVTAPAPITTNDGADGGFPVAKSGVVMLRGIGFDSDGGAPTAVWTELGYPTHDHDNDDATADVLDITTDRELGVSGIPGEIKAPRKPVLTIDNAFSEDASFAVPEVTDQTVAATGSLVIPIALTVVDSMGVYRTAITTVTINNDNDAPKANAGGDQQITPGSFVRLNGAGSSDSDGDTLRYSWAYTGISAHPLTQERTKIVTDGPEEKQGFVEGKWFPYDGVSHIMVPDDTNTPADADDDPDLVQVFSDNTLDPATATDGVFPAGIAGGPASDGADGEAGTDDDIVPVDFNVMPDGGDAVRGDYHPTAGGALNSSGGGNKYPYFEAPELSGFNSVQLTFTLTVTDNGQDGMPDNLTDVSTESDDDKSNSAETTITLVSEFFSGNVAGPDFCAGLSLGGARTFAYDSDGDGVADICSLRSTRRFAVARQNALETLAALNAGAFATSLLGEADNPRDGTCGKAPANLGDSEAALKADSCSREKVASPPPPADPATADVFFSGTITGPNFCTNLSLGGARIYPFDSDGDGVADTCSLPFTKREAVARQNALESAAWPEGQFSAALSAACASLGSTGFGDDPAALAKDGCNPGVQQATLGDPLPSK